MKYMGGYAKILTASLIWGTLGAFARWSGLSPFDLSFFRLLVAAFALFAVLPREQRMLIFYTKQYPLVFLSGLLFALDCLLYFNALSLTTLSNAVLPYNMQPVIIAVLAPVFLKEKMQRGHFRALLFSLLGLGLIIYPSVTALSYQDLLGVGLAVGGAICLSVIALITKLLAVRASTFVYYMTVIAAVCLLPFARLISPQALQAQSLAFIAIIGLVHTAAAYILYYSGLRAVNTQYAAALTYLIPVVAVLSGYIFFSEQIGIFTIVGGLLIIINSITVLFGGTS